MIDMHPEIRKFWENMGIKIRHIPWMELYVYDSELTGINTLADYKLNEITYYFDHVWYSEEQMLRLVKLKAFL